MTIHELAAIPQMRAAKTVIKESDLATLDEQLQLTAIAAPTGAESNRAAYVRNVFVQEELDDVYIDSAGNLWGTLHGSGQTTGTVVLAAHLDTVFAADTDLTPTFDFDGVIHAPGICDDARGLAELLCILRTVRSCHLIPQCDIIFCTTVGEEGLGDLKGSREVFSCDRGIKAFFTLDSSPAETIVHQAVGSTRFEFTFSGAGGHSLYQFGNPNPNHALGRAIAKIADIEVPKDPRTTYNVGVVKGGGSVNSIPKEAKIQVDMRSIDNSELQKLRDKVLAAVEAAVKEENNRWNVAEKVILSRKSIGDRPGGSQPQDAPIVQLACDALAEVGLTPKFSAASTDANIPISLGIPALSLGRGGKTGKTHSVEEWYDPEGAWIAPYKNLLILFGAAGLANS